MSTNLIPIKSFLGKYCQELTVSSTQDKYKSTQLSNFFEQRFLIQNNKVQMVVDQDMIGLSILASGNEIRISKILYDHPNVVVSNSVENTPATNPRSLYNPAIFSTLAYLVCQNHTSILITGDIDEPIYVQFRSDYETFYNSVLVFNISTGINVEIVEEFKSNGAINSVINYILGQHSRLKLTTFYNSNITSLSFCYRNIIAQENSRYEHILLGEGASSVIDENKITLSADAAAEVLGVVKSFGRKFHSILYVYPAATTYTIDVVYKHILSGNAVVTFFPAITDDIPTDNSATIEITSTNIDDNKDLTYTTNYIKDIIDRVVLERTSGSVRFYDNKAKFLVFHK